MNRDTEAKIEEIEVSAASFFAEDDVHGAKAWIAEQIRNRIPDAEIVAWAKARGMGDHPFALMSFSLHYTVGTRAMQQARWPPMYYED
jgi:hypothetical protein